MVNRKEAFSIQILQLVDAGLVWLGFTVASLLRSPLREIRSLPPTDAAGLEQMTWVLFISVPFTPLLLEFFRFYRTPRTKTTVVSIKQLVRTLFVLGLVLGMIALFIRPLEGIRFDASRVILGGGVILSFLFLLIRDRVFTYLLSNRQVRDIHKERVVIAGSTQEIAQFEAELDPEIIDAWDLTARFDLESCSVDEFYQLLKLHSVERVIFTAGGTSFDRLSLAIEACELQGVEAWVGAAFIRTQIARPTFDVVGNQPMLVLRSTPELSWEVAMKAVFDRVGALFLILATSPLWIVAWLGIRISSPGASAFFAQKRAGRYGKPFRMWKFRTMVPNAEAMLEQIKQEQGNEMDGPVFKLKRDPRIFPFGALLRKLSIDELPQLLNVLLGDMSLVGPRPLPLYEVEAFEKSAHRRRLSVKPGITCEWQAGGRNRITSFEEWVRMDLEYIDNWSLWLDFKILLKTIPAVLFGRGAA
ncbi:exopolysaccharide biosynthesis polyprenyl glycosylphosphotransferase [Haloferula luteola]|uniref:Exopolysaccharide biosynthesis polyprenyl glycosylphosphotransferase n=1 Tax=Haloferula luteola TaxID=595692 RepID=A0A840V5B2_9BACT|nr:sugar transferase [Haloferula luteola]MBB5350814.1 exopolysaccharide biosynthesis polyprenyl glycosylphosphotransferase [Haloferula luteola]